MEKNSLFLAKKQLFFFGRNLIRAMKVTIALLIISIHVCANSNAQKLTLKTFDSPLKQVLELVEKQSGYNFVYSDDLIRSEKVSINLSNVNLLEGLEAILKQTKFSFKLQADRIIIITPRFNNRNEFQNVDEDGSLIIKVVDENNKPLEGATIQIGTLKTLLTDKNGILSTKLPPGKYVVEVSYTGYEKFRSEVIISDGNTSTINGKLTVQSSIGDEVVVIGYGSQKKSDITGAVSSLGKERLQNVPNTTVAQALQGSISGLVVRTGAGGAVADQSINIRGRNSITASTDPLIVLDGTPYYGTLNDINPNDIESVEVLKDASSSAIYGSRGANGVILITSKMGRSGKPKINYNGYYSFQSFVKLPDLMTGPEFFNFKNERDPITIIPGSIEATVHENGDWVDWVDLALRKGQSTEHNISVSGGAENLKYFFSTGYLDVKGLAINDNYQRITTRVNLDAKITNWLTIGTKNQLLYDDRSGLSPTWEGDQGVFKANPNSIARDENNNLTVNPWDDVYYGNPLSPTLATNNDNRFQIISNNYLKVNFPFVPGLTYTLNTGVTARFRDVETYFGRNTLQGITGRGNTNNERFRNVIVENILAYSKVFGDHSVGFTGVYSYENIRNTGTGLSTQGYSNDFLGIYGAADAGIIVPLNTLFQTVLVSQMGRLNYSYKNKYLITATARRDGFSAFGANSKFGIFPSMALGWNIAEENFFPRRSFIDKLKIRLAYGINGNQAVSPYSSLAFLRPYSYVDGSSTLAGYVPSQLASSTLGWERAENINIGLDFSMFGGRVSGDLNLFRTTTSDLLLRRSISSIHGISTILQNIGSIQNKGLEITLNSKILQGNNFNWSVSANASYLQNKILSLYGLKDEKGKEIDDIANGWFIGKPISTNYGFIWDGLWQQNQATEAALYNTEPGYVKLRDINRDTVVDANDRVFIGQSDPKFLWGLTNSFNYKAFSLVIFVHGVHGVTRVNPLAFDFAETGAQITRNVTRREFWSANNQDAKFPVNIAGSETMNGIVARSYENAGFVRLKDVTLAYDISKSSFFNSSRISRFQVYVTGRNLITVTNWTGLDPEISSQFAVPLQKEFVFGLNITL